MQNLTQNQTQNQTQNPDPSGDQDGPADYQRVAAAIRFIREKRLEQPDLSEVAAAVDLSPHHFQRLFTQWAGVSPKRFLGYLTQQHARELLAENKDVLNASLEVGLSGPGRLHDLCVNLEAATPGEIKSGGAGITIETGWHPSPFGEVLVHQTGRGICGISFAENAQREEAEASMKARWPNAHFVQSPVETAKTAARIFAGPTATNPLRAFINGTNFQMQVWKALVRIPPGSLTTYGHIAKAIANPKAARAVGAAVGQNPVGFLIPCHRVIRESGAIDGYRWGSDRKAAMIGWEAAASAKTNA